jgi:hypothetical protein
MSKKRELSIYHEEEVFEIENISMIKESKSGKAVLIHSYEYGEIWIPKSQIRDNDDIWTTRSLIITYWLAEQKELS